MRLKKIAAVRRRGYHLVIPTKSLLVLWVWVSERTSQLTRSSHLCVITFPQGEIGKSKTKVSVNGRAECFRSILNQIVIRFHRTALRAYPVVGYVFIVRAGSDAAVRVAEGFVIDVRAVAAAVFFHQNTFTILSITLAPDAPWGGSRTRIELPGLFYAAPVQ